MSAFDGAPQGEYERRDVLHTRSIDRVDTALKNWQRLSSKSNDVLRQLRSRVGLAWRRARALALDAFSWRASCGRAVLEPRTRGDRCARFRKMWRGCLLHHMRQLVRNQTHALRGLGTKLTC